MPNFEEEPKPEEQPPFDQNLGGTPNLPPAGDPGNGNMPEEGASQPHFNIPRDDDGKPLSPWTIASASEYGGIRMGKSTLSAFDPFIYMQILEQLSVDGAHVEIGQETQPPEKQYPTLDDIGGHSKAKESIRKFLAATQHPEVFRNWAATPPKGLLLYGPSGTGKTMFAEAIANELFGHFEAIKLADINSKWFGESEERVKRIFEEARFRDGHTVIFIDEIESLLPVRNPSYSSGVKDSIMTMFLQYMDGIDSPDNVTIIGATNRPNAIDPAVLRPGRMDRHIEIGYPDLEARTEILDIHIATAEKAAGRQLFDLQKVDVGRLLKGADVLTGAQIAEVIRRACEAKAYEAVESEAVSLITVEDLIESFASVIIESI